MSRKQVRTRSLSKAEFERILDEHYPCVLGMATGRHLRGSYGASPRFRGSPQRSLRLCGRTAFVPFVQFA